VVAIGQSQVCIVGFGARTPVGTNAVSSAAAVRAGIAMFAEHPYMVDKDGNRMIVAMDAFLSDDVGSAHSFLEIGLTAAEEALAPLLHMLGRAESIQMLIGLPEKRPGLPNALSEKITAHFKHAFQEHFRVMEVETFNAGHSAGLMALEEGFYRILHGSAEICLVGGIESYRAPESLEWLDDEGQLHSEGNNWGFIPGEAAGFCLICSKNVADLFKLEILGKILSVATELETNLIKTDSVCLGKGLSKAVKQVLNSLSPETKVDYMICDVNGEPYRGDELGYTFVRISGRFNDPSDFITPADCWGDVGAASGPLYITLAIVAGLKGYAKGPHTLVWTSSEGGQRSAALLYTGDFGG